jgi:biopolymer transport protein ExbD
MIMHIPSSRPKRHARIEIIPLIDIMFFLLATFVMVSLSMVKNRGINVLLPQASSSTAQEHKDHVSVSVTETGQLYLDKQEVTQAQLVDALRELKQKNTELRVFINGDQNARLGLAIAVLDETRKLGITKVTFETRAATTSP